MEKSFKQNVNKPKSPTVTSFCGYFEASACSGSRGSFKLRENIIFNVVCRSVLAFLCRTVSLGFGKDVMQVSDNR